VAALQYITEDPVRQSARVWAGGGDGSQNIYAGSSAVPQGRFQDTVTKQVYCGTANHTLAPATGCGTFNTAVEPNLIQGRMLINGSLDAHYDISNSVSLYSSSFFTNRKSNARLNPQPVGDIYPSAKWLDGIVIPATNPSNPTGHALALRKRFFEGGDRLFDDNVNTFQERVGVKGSFWNDWTFDAGYQYGESDSNNYTHGAVNLTHIQELVGAQPCGAGAPAGCGSVLLAGPGSLTAAQSSYATYVGSDTSRYNQNVAFVDIAGTLPWGLPAGNIGVAIGGDWRREAVKATPDALKQTGDFAEGTTLPTQGQYSVSEIYAEISVPLLKDVPFAQSLSLDLAGRLSDYTSFGNANVYKGSVNWQVNDVVRLRGGYGTGVRAPQVGGEMFLGANQSADAFADPCVKATNSTVIANCRTAIGAGYNPATFTQAAPQLSAARVGNPNLLPETSKQWNIGAAFTFDQFVSGLTATVDYYNIHLNNYITLIDPGSAVSLCYASAGMTDPNCANIGARNPTNGALTSYREPYTNLGFIHTDGVDFGVNWVNNDLLGNVGLDGWGLGVDTQWTYLNSFQKANLDGSVTEYAGTYSEGAISYGQPKWKGLFSTSLSMPDGGPTFQVTERYIGGTYNNPIFGETPGDPGYTVPALLFTDVNVNIPWNNYSLNLGIDNLFDKNPPLAIDPYVQTLTNQYDFAGRFFYVKATVKL
jgi:outer membrane receptor protein involved in Fe transport